MSALITLIVALGVPGILPALAVARRSPVVVFLAPLAGALMAAVAATIELGIAGSLVVDYVIVAVLVNAAVIAWWLRSGRSVPFPAQWRWGWLLATAAGVLGCAAIPLAALRAPFIGWDGNSIWLMHSLMAYGGHHAYLAGLQNVADRFDNPDYPPLIPATIALTFRFFGLGNLHLGPVMTALLTSCGLGVAGTGLVTAVSRAGAVSRVAAIAAGGALCVAGFGVGWSYAVGGYVDLMWTAAAVGAVIWGLVLPPSRQALGVAWICAAVASLSKNEGLTTALIMLALIALRYRPLTMPGPRLRRWTERGLFVLVPALPGLAWAGLIHLLGIHDNFFANPSTESMTMRAEATAAGMAGHLQVAPVAIAVLIIGSVFLRGRRERAGLGNPLWLWGTCLAYLAVLFVTYVHGSLEIHWWLMDSVNRTTDFAQVVLFADLATWLVIAVDEAFSRTDGDPMTSGYADGKDTAGTPSPSPASLH